MKSTLHLYLFFCLGMILFGCSKEEEDSQPTTQNGFKVVLHEADGSPEYLKVQFPAIDIGYLLTNYSVYRSRNSGETWNQVFQTTISNFSRPLCLAMDFYNSDNGVILIRNDDTHYLLKTEDGGDSWDTTFSDTIILTDIAWPSPSQILAVGPERILHSSDLGANWLFATTTPMMDVTGSLAYIDFAEGDDWNVGYLATSRELYKTIDVGLNWTKVNDLDYGIWGINFYSENNGSIWSHKGIRFTEDGGNNWEIPNFNDTAINTNLLFNPFYLDENSIFLSGHARTYAVLGSDDAGKNIYVQREFPRVNNVGYSTSYIHMIDELTGFACGTKVKLLEDSVTINGQSILMKTTTGWK